ncbi:hypothetical protein OAG23_01095 [bacterium]|nr:hypothetical protein [bacterium]
MDRSGFGSKLSEGLDEPLIDLAVKSGLYDLGLGPSAVSTINRTRHQNVCDTAAYLKRISAVGHAQETSEILDDEAWRLERIALQLRTTEGLPNEFLLPEIDLSHLKAQGLIEQTETHLRLTGQGPLLVDSIAAELA